MENLYGERGAYMDDGEESACNAAPILPQVSPSAQSPEV